MPSSADGVEVGVKEQPGLAGSGLVRGKEVETAVAAIRAGDGEAARGEAHGLGDKFQVFGERFFRLEGCLMWRR